MYSAKHETCTRIRLIFPHTLYIPDIKRVCRRARGTCGPFARLHHRKNLESKRVSLYENRRDGKDNVGATKTRPVAINKFHPE